MVEVSQYLDTLKLQVNHIEVLAMPVGLPGKIAALFMALEVKHLEEIAPAERRRFADLCRHWAALAARDGKDAPKVGFIAELADGRGRE